MSRIGRKPIQIPEGAEVKAEGQRFEVKGKLGELACEIPASVSYSIVDGIITFTRASDRPQHRADHGLARALVNNLVVGATEGFRKALELEGTGYKWESRGQEVLLNVGFSHSITIPVPAGVQVEMKGATCEVSGPDKQAVGFVAAQIRKARPVEPYKGKGIRYKGEFVRRKAGKAGV